MSKFQLLAKATSGILHFKQRALDLINEYIREQERTLKLTPSNFMRHVVVRYTEGKEQFNKPAMEKLLHTFKSSAKLLYENGEKSILISHLGHRESVILPLKIKWNIKNPLYPINIELNFLAGSEDAKSTFCLGFQVIGLLDEYVSFEFPQFFIGDIGKCVGDQIKVRIEVKSDRMIWKMKLVINDDNLTAPWTNWKEDGDWGEYLEEDMFTWDRFKSVDDDLVMIPFIKMEGEKGSEMHLISHFVTFGK